MAKARNPNQDKAFEIYKEHNGNITNRAIAELLGEDEKVIAVWKSRNKWNVVQQSNQCCTTKKKGGKNNKDTNTKKPVLEEVESVMENDDLTDKQRLFCLYYVKCFNATKAYMKAYGVDEYSANANGNRLIVNDSIKKQIKELKKARLNREMLDANDIFQKYMDIAFANITDYADFGTESFTYIDKRGEEKEGQASYVRLKESSTVDGTLIQEVKMGKDGASIKLKDGMKALQWLSDHMDLATEEQRAKIAYIKAQTDKITGEDKGNSVADDWIESVKEADEEKQDE